MSIISSEDETGETMREKQYWYEDPELKEIIRRDPGEGFRQCLLLVKSDDPTERYRAAYALEEISTTCSIMQGSKSFGGKGVVNQEQVYDAIWQLIRRSLAAKDWEAGAAAIVILSTSLKFLPSDEDSRSPMRLVELCSSITRPLIWQRVLQHLYYFYDRDDAVGDFLEDYLHDEEALFSDIAKAALARVRGEG